MQDKNFIFFISPVYVADIRVLEAFLRLIL